MTASVVSEYYSAGGNRHSGAADWSASSGLVAFGADQNVGIWSPLNDAGRGISALLSGHKAKVTAVRFLTCPSSSTPDELLVTGSADGEIAAWNQDGSSRQGRWHCLTRVPAHDGTVNTIYCLGAHNIFATGGADATVKVWRVQAEESRIEALATLPLKPRFIPLALAVGLFGSDESQGTAFLVVGGTRNDIQVFSLENLPSKPQIKLRATLTGHEAWIRSLALTRTGDADDDDDDDDDDGGYLLASASQDKYVRIWRFHSGNQQRAVLTSTDTNAPSTLAAKVQTVPAGSHTYSITFEALLLGHDDWIYSASWSPSTRTGAGDARLLTASADGSLSIWESDPISGIWLSVSRLGEISSQKGATTATGSAGGFWTALWSPNGKAVTSLGRTGSWRLWQYYAESQFWTQRHGISGHVGAVTGLCWSPEGSYLLTTSADQTTRLHAQWKRGGQRSWHEFSRPQIHGYDLNCITSISPWQFCSGADEKLLRVFNQPRDVAGMLNRLCGIPLPAETGTEVDGTSISISMPERAAIPVLGLSNKAMDESEVVEANGLDTTGTADDMGASDAPSLVTISEPPTEDVLSRHTLWPEHEKLYGHGSEISEAATSTSRVSLSSASASASASSPGAVLATTCKASSTDQAVIRLYDTTSWTEAKPALTAHSLTVTRLAFSKGRDEAEYLLSVGRDRQWAVFRRGDDPAEAADGTTDSKSGVKATNNTKGWIRIANNPKAHSRMILDAAWLPGTEDPSFVTAGRDKTIKIWTGKRDQNQNHDRDRDRDHDHDYNYNYAFTLKASIARSSPVTAIAVAEVPTDGTSNTKILAAGQDDGTISLHVIVLDPEVSAAPTSTVLSKSKSVDLSRDLCPSRAVNRLAWRPRSQCWVGASEAGEGTDIGVGTDTHTDTHTDTSPAGIYSANPATATATASARARARARAGAGVNIGELAVASADGSVRILSVDLDLDERAWATC
ncbi:Elongator complex protein 2 [Cladophialophora carrionii]|uniref:Elongator complex protein 2 n=1 Tax=Cladophialophora carrionii TaxID=86049 RepID=A0A1C1CQL8_9EURO|nr:Elongator complex protein 2 [Cladophialophora carrionii]